MAIMRGIIPGGGERSNREVEHPLGLELDKPRAKHEVDILAEDGVTNEIEVRELCTCKDKRRLQFRARTNSAIPCDSVSATEIGSSSDEAAGIKDERAFENGARLDRSGTVNRNLTGDNKLKCG
jgi:hypothetical protein